MSKMVQTVNEISAAAADQSAFGLFKPHISRGAGTLNLGYFLQTDIVEMHQIMQRLTEAQHQKTPLRRAISPEARPVLSNWQA